jgi:hypothetical protein
MHFSTARENTLRLVAVAASLCLLALSAQGLSNVWNNLGALATPMQWAMSAAQLSYAALGIYIVAQRWRRGYAPRSALLCWLACFTAAVALIPAAWVADELSATPAYALAAAGVGTLLLLGLPSPWEQARRS